MVFDASVNIGHIITIAVTLAGGYVALRVMVASLSQSFTGLADRVRDLEEDVKALNRVVVSNAVTEERLSALRSELANFMTTQMNSHTEWRTWVRKQFDRVENEIRKVELKSVSEKLNHAIEP